MNLVNLPLLPHLSNLPYLPLAKGALLSCYVNCLVACLQINFGEFATFVRFVKFAMFMACKGDYLMYCLIMLSDELGKYMLRLPHLSNLSYSLRAKALLLADEFDKFRQICCCMLFWTYLNYII